MKLNTGSVHWTFTENSARGKARMHQDNCELRLAIAAEKFQAINLTNAGQSYFKTCVNIFWASCYLSHNYYTHFLLFVDLFSLESA